MNNLKTKLCLFVKMAKTNFTFQQKMRLLSIYKKYKCERNQYAKTIKKARKENMIVSVSTIYRIRKRWNQTKSVSICQRDNISV